jgi:hypothetical protein
MAVCQQYLHSTRGKGDPIRFEASLTPANDRFYHHLNLAPLRSAIGILE